MGQKEIQNKKIYNVMHLMILFSLFILIEDISNVYFAKASEYVTIILHIMQIILVVHFLSVNHISIKKLVRIREIDIPLMFISFVIGILILLFGSFMESIVVPVQQNELVNAPQSFGYTIFVLFYAAFIAPIVEEIEFRGLLFNALYEEKRKLIKAVIVSSFMFMIIHTGSFNYGAFVLGIISCIMYKKTRNLVYSIIIHFSGNFIVCLLALVGNLKSNTETNLVFQETSLSTNEVMYGVSISIILCIVILVLLVFFMMSAFHRIEIKCNKISNEFDNLSMTNQKSVWSNMYFGIYIFLCFLAWIIQR